MELGELQGLITKEIKSKVDGRVVFSAVLQVNASSLLLSLYGKGYEACLGFLCNRLFCFVCLFTINSRLASL